ncbi:hypothetical protein BC830DRAFT_1157547 [Chytriomyces sp. MP71]|nr:hypothetical protein BC830DRAFT_1157547 [Chytriomyces sp. MP71]
MNSLAQGAIAGIFRSLAVIKARTEVKYFTEEMHRLADLKDRAAFFFWLSNLIEFFRLLESVRLREEAKPFNGAITKIVTRVVLTTRSILEDSLLPTLFSSLCEHAASLAEPALFDCLKLGTGWLGASRSNGTGRLKLNHYLSNLGGLMQACKLPLDLWERIMLRLLKTVGDTSMNAIWKLKGTLTPAIASTIDENLETVIGWFVVIGMEDARREVMVLKDTLDAITHRKECAADVNSLLSSLAVMNAKQILHVLTVCCDPKVMAETVKDEFWSCLNEHANTISMHSIDLNDHSQVTTSNDHSQVTTSDCESLTLVPKNNCSHFVPATILLHEHILRLF